MITDDSLDLARWPNAVIDVVFEKPRDAAPRGLTLSIELDTSPYRPQPDWQQRALEDAALYDGIARQFRAADLALSMQCSLDGNKPHSLAAEAFAGLADGVASYLRELLDGATPPAPARLVLHVPVEPESVDDLFALDVTVLASSPQRKTVSKLSPRSAVEFAGAFEAAYRDEETYFKVLGESEAREKIDARSLWLLRMRAPGAAPGRGIAFATNGSARYYLPVPLSHVPLSRNDVPVVAFDAADGVDWENPHNQTFSGVDMELWARIALGAIGAFLSVDSVPNEKRNELAQIKDQLAARIAAAVYPVLSGDALPRKSAPLENAIKIMRRQIMGDAENAYEIAAICQFEAIVSSPYDDAPAIGVYAPRFVGTLRSDPPCAFSTVGTVLAPDKAFITSALKLERANAQTHLPLNLHFEIERVLYAGARAPLWFVIPFDRASTVAPHTTIGAVDVPIVLRQVPQAPALASQAASPTHVEPSTVAQAKQWTYAMTFDKTIVDHDTIDVCVSYNNSEGVEEADVWPAASGRDLDLFGHLARIAAVWPAMAAELAHAPASRIDALTSDFLRLVKPLPAAWAAWSVPQRPQVQQVPGTRINLTLRERQDGEFLMLARTLSAGDDACVPEPVIQVPDEASTYTAQPGSEPGEFYYVDENGKRLTYEAALKLARRRVTFAGLDIAAFQNASVSISVTRNEALLRDSQGRVVATNEQFVFSGPPAAFAGNATPRQSFRERFDLGTLSTPKRQTLARHLEQLMLLLYERTGPAATLALGFDAAYVQPIADGLPDAVVPIFAVRHVRAQRERAMQLAGEYAAAILDWFAKNRPPGGYFRFSLTLFARVGEGRIPLLELPALDLETGDITDLPGT